MGPTRAVATYTLLGGRSRTEYTYMALIWLGLLSYRIFQTQDRIAEALASGDTELAQILRRTAALSPLSTFLPLVTLISIAGCGVISGEFRNRTAIMVLTRIERLQFYLGSWIGLMLFVAAAYAVVLTTAGGLMFYYGFSPPALLWLALLKEFVATAMVYTVAFAFGAVSQRPARFFLGACFLNGLVTNSAKFSGVARYVFEALHLLYPAQLQEDLLHTAVTTSRAQTDNFLTWLVITENFFYIGAILLVAFVVFKRREVMAR